MSVETSESLAWWSLKRFLPTSLFGRALLILVIPTVLIQLVAIYIFYERHWASITRNLSSSLASEVAMLVYEVHHASESERNYRRALAAEMQRMKIRFLEKEAYVPVSQMDGRFDSFVFHMKRRLRYPFSVEQLPDDHDIRIQVQLPDSTLVVEVSKKRLVSSTTMIFVLWVVGTAVILLLIATLFLRNQIRPIIRLAEAAEKFGKGKDDPDFKPHGASEVRQAAAAFLTMRSRLKRQMEGRTAMLSGISHDLRTPLTRMKLQLAMLEDSEAAQALNEDIEDMQHMVQEYIDYIRGEGSEEMIDVDLEPYMELVLDHYIRNDQKVRLHVERSVKVVLRRRAFRRALDNLIHNALRYGGGECDITLSVDVHDALILIQDKGKGIPEESFDLVFQPFKRLESSRNSETGGVGLGMSIAKDIILAHGGEILLENVKKGKKIVGLQIEIRIPKEKSLISVD